MNVPEKLIGRREFLKAAAGLLVAGGLGVAACKPGESTPHTVKETLPTAPLIPGTTPATNPEYPPTTIDKRVFTSPEQKAQVEKVESAIQRFYELTPDAIANYKSQVAFRPEGNGFSTLSTQSPGYYNTMAINLGMFDTQIGTAGGKIEVFGLIREDGTRVVCSQTIEALDSELVSLYPGANVNLGAGIVKENDLGAYETGRAISGSAYDGEMKGSDNVAKYFEDHIGYPIWFEYNVNPDWVRELHLTPNQLLLDTYQTINGPDGIKEIYTQYTAEQLQTIGIFTDESTHIPQGMLDGSRFPTIQEAYVHLPALATARFFTNVPPVLT